MNTSILNEISYSINNPKRVEIPFRIVVKKMVLKRSKMENKEGQLSSSYSTIECICGTENKWAQRINERRVDSDKNQRDIKTIKVNDGHLYRKLIFDPNEPNTDDPPYTGVVDKGDLFLKDIEELSYFQMGKPLRQYGILKKALKDCAVNIEGNEMIGDEKCYKVLIPIEGGYDYTYVYWFLTDKDRGVHKIVEYDNKDRVRFTYDVNDLKDFGDGVWLPKKVITKAYYYKDDNDEAHDVVENSYELVIFEKGYVTSPEMFTIDFPQGTEIMDMLRRKTIIVGQEK
jgi:hypothetical protein